VRLPVLPLQQSKLQTTDVKHLAPGSYKPDDPDICDDTDPQTKLGGAQTSYAIYKWPSQTHVDNLYVRSWVLEQICTGAGTTLSSQDQSRLDDVLNALQITKAKAFAATVSITADNGVKFPDMVPFSYSIDQKAKQYSVQAIPQNYLPWQATSAFQLQVSLYQSTLRVYSTA